MRASIALNGFAGRTRIIEAAAGAADQGSVHLYATLAEPKNATIVHGDFIADPQIATISSVPLWTAEAVEREFGRVDFLKIDAEGAEEDIIMGLRPILAKHSPDLVLEFNAARYKDPARFLTEVNSFYGSMSYVEHSGDLTPIEVAFDKLLEAGVPRMEAMKTVARERGLSKREVYQKLNER